MRFPPHSVLLRLSSRGPYPGTRLNFPAVSFSGLGSWLKGVVALDEKGFVITGGPHGFDSTPYATNTAGIYAVGDARTASVKRVASAVGEGSVVISDVHRYLTHHQDALTTRG